MVILLDIPIFEMFQPGSRTPKLQTTTFLISTISQRTCHFLRLYHKTFHYFLEKTPYRAFMSLSCSVQQKKLNNLRHEEIRPGWNYWGFCENQNQSKDA